MKDSNLSGIPLSKYNLTTVINDFVCYCKNSLMLSSKSKTLKRDSFSEKMRVTGCLQAFGHLKKQNYENLTASKLRIRF